jgi:hypothetical protein
MLTEFRTQKLSNTINETQMDLEDIGAGVPDLPKPKVTGGLSAPKTL